MTTAHISRNIAAAPEVIWTILTDATQLADGTFSIIKIDGQKIRGVTI